MQNDEPKQVLLTQELREELLDENGNFYTMRGAQYNSEYIAKEGFVYQPCLGYCGRKPHSVMPCVRINIDAIVVKQNNQEYLTKESYDKVEKIARSYKVARRGNYGTPVDVTGYMYKTGDDYREKNYYTVYSNVTGDSFFIGIPYSKKQYVPGVYRVTGYITNYKGIGTNKREASYINNPVIVKVS